jgi:hypothetical protein
MDFYLELGFTRKEAGELYDAERAVAYAQQWDYLRNPNVPGKDGFMFCTDHQCADIMTYMECRHNGVTFEWVMKRMQEYAILGSSGFARMYLQKSKENK